MILELGNAVHSSSARNQAEALNGRVVPKLPLPPSQHSFCSPHRQLTRLYISSKRHVDQNLHRDDLSGSKVGFSKITRFPDQGPTTIMGDASEAVPV